MRRALGVACWSLATWRTCAAPFPGRLSCRYGCSGTPTAPSIWTTRPRCASRPEDLSTFLNGDTLAALWPDLFLPKGVRQAWEDRYPVLRATPATAA